MLGKTISRQRRSSGLAYQQSTLRPEIEEPKPQPVDAPIRRKKMSVVHADQSATSLKPHPFQAEANAATKLVSSDEVSARGRSLRVDWNSIARRFRSFVLTLAQSGSSATQSDRGLSKAETATHQAAPMRCPLNASCRQHPIVNTNTVCREYPTERCTRRVNNPLNPQHLHLSVLPDRDALPDSFSSPPKRLLATMLFTDLVGSTELAMKIGDESWGMVVSNHYTLSLAELDRFNGRLVRKTGDGVVALFDSPSSAVACARAISRTVKLLGLSVRAGIHSGEIGCDNDGEIFGIAVHMAARVCDQANKDEVLVSRTVRDLVAGAPFDFDDIGARAVKGMTEPLHLYRLDKSSNPAEQAVVSR